MSSMASLQQRLMKLQLNLRQETESNKRRSSVDHNNSNSGHSYRRGTFSFNPFRFGSESPSSSSSSKSPSGVAMTPPSQASSSSPSPQNPCQNGVNLNINAQCLSPRPRPKALPIGMMSSPGRPNSPSRHPKQLAFGPSSFGTTSNMMIKNYNNSNSGDDSIRFSEKFQHTNILTLDGRPYPAAESDFRYLHELGSGSCGQVVKMCHLRSGRILAVKQMRRSGNEDESKRIAMDLDVLLKCHDCEHIVQCHGYLIKDTEVWICMELMSTCFEKLLKELQCGIPERILGKIAVATVKALNYLKENHGVIHRDVKPSNILINEKGIVKLCDFGIAGRLVDSKAKTRQAGCAAYMAPERIDPPDPTKPSYDIRADVWSFGISLVELAMGKFPYSECKTDFEVLTKVIQNDPPSLPEDGSFSTDFCSFVKTCLTKDYRKRPKYKKLLEHNFIKYYENEYVDVESWFASVTNTTTNSMNQINGSISVMD